MTALAFLAGLALGGLTVGWAARKQIIETKADALRLLTATHSIDLSVEDAARRAVV
jgi:hypothetical protein